MRNAVGRVCGHLALTRVRIVHVDEIARVKNLTRADKGTKQYNMC